MREHELNILEQYDINIRSTKKVRDAVLCDTDKGLFLIKEVCVSEKRLQLLEQLGVHIRQQGYENIDWILKNKEDGLVVVSEEGTKYFLKKWFPGKECDIYKEKDVLDAVENLTRVHRVLRNFTLEEKEGTLLMTRGEDLRQEYFRHNREMKKVRSFMRDRVGKGDFELAFLKHFDAMYAQADHALEELKLSNYEELYNESIQSCKIIHGDYNYHNVLMTYSGMATTNFEHAQMNLQIVDLYYFLRKVMEKHHWDVKLGDKILNCYQKYLPFKKGELKFISICLAYPEKFWKTANSYSRSRKVWIPVKNLEKLEMVIKQTEEKKQFLHTIFSFQLE